MIARRGTEADIRTRVGCHTFRATGILGYLRNGGKLEIIKAMANHESERTTNRLVIEQTRLLDPS